MGKILPIVVMVLFFSIAIVPSINAIDNKINNDTTKSLGLGRIIIRGFGLFPHFNGDNLTFFYPYFNSNLFGWITLHKPILGCSFIGPFNLVIYLFGVTFRGGIDW